MPSFPTIFLEVLSKFRGVNVQQFLQVPCPTKSLGGCHVQQFFGGRNFGNQFPTTSFLGECISTFKHVDFPQKTGTPGPRPSKKSLPQKIIDIWGRYPTYGNMGWFTDTNHHAPPGPPVPGTMSEQNLPRLRVNSVGSSMQGTR